MQIIEQSSKTMKWTFRCSRCKEEFQAFHIGMINCPRCGHYKFIEDIINHPGGHDAILKNIPGGCPDGDIGSRGG
jgi:DNA-directed RNA polymerase subunit RPC12/RpoP